MDIPISLKSRYNNVKVDIYTMEYNDELSRSILSDTPAVTGVYMSIIEKEEGKEGFGTGGFDKDRQNMFSISCENNLKLVPYIKAGNVLEVTHNKQLVFGNYAVATKLTRYIISKTHTHSPTSPYIIATARSVDEQQ